MSVPDIVLTGLAGVPAVFGIPAAVGDVAEGCVDARARLVGVVGGALFCVVSGHLTAQVIQRRLRRPSIVATEWSSTA